MSAPAGKGSKVRKPKNKNDLGNFSFNRAKIIN